MSGSKQEVFYEFLWQNSIRSDSSTAKKMKQLVCAGVDVSEAFNLVQTEEHAQVLSKKRDRKPAGSYCQDDGEGIQVDEKGRAISSGHSKHSSSGLIGAKPHAEASHAAAQKHAAQSKNSSKRAPSSCLPKSSSKPPAKTTGSKPPRKVTPKNVVSKPAAKSSTNMNHHPFLEDIGGPAEPKNREPTTRPASKKVVVPDSESEYVTEKESDDAASDVTAASDEDGEKEEKFPAVQGVIFGDINTPPERVPHGEFPGHYPANSRCRPVPRFTYETSPLEIFNCLIKSDETMPRLVEQTNLKFVQWQQAGGKTFDKDEDDQTNAEVAQANVARGKVCGSIWTPVDIPTMYIFMSMCFYMAILGLADTAMYWNEIADGLIPIFGWALLSGISYSRWRQIKKFLTVNIIRDEDILQTGDRKGRTADKFHRLRPLINTLRSTFMMFVKAGLLWSIDESICPYRGKYCPAKVYMKDKPHKFGLKIWSLNCACTGYCYDFKVYEGKGDVFEGEPPEWVANYTLGERVVLNMSNNTPKGSYLFCDRFFTTPRLCAVLLGMGKYITGTAKKLVSGFVRQVIFKKRRTIGRGFYQWAFDTINKVVHICWLDRQPVLFLSNVYGAAPAEGGVNRLTTTSGQHQRKQMKAPLAAQQYNKYMGGTDVFDRLKLNR
jgi:Transposase IS4